MAEPTPWTIIGVQKMWRCGGCGVLRKRRQRAHCQYFPMRRVKVTVLEDEPRE